MSPGSRRHRLIAALAVIALAAAIAYFALRSSPYLQYIPWLPRPVGVWADSNGIIRNVAAFFVLGSAVFFFIGRRALHVALLCAFGTALEVSQIWIRGRVFDWRDIVASIAGILLAWPVVWMLRRRAA
jgi:glycopeptide antibiotics resistance protein